jgi:hypothetical protein
MSLVAAVTGMAGTFGSVYGVFAKFDRDQSDENRNFVRDWLLGLHVNEEKWRNFFDELFSKLFGKKHLSLTCAARSCALSIALITVVWFIVELKSPYGAQFDEGIVPFFVIGCIIDYFSLWKTRYFLTRLKSFQKDSTVAGIIVVDIIITTLIFIVGYVVMWATILGPFTGGSFSGALALAFEGILVNLDPRAISVTQLLYLAALLTSAWLWVYLLVAYAMRSINFVPRWIKPLSKVTDFEHHPVRTIGYVAATVSAVVVAIVTLV